MPGLGSVPRWGDAGPRGTRSSEPALPPEPEELREGDRDDHAPGVRIAVVPAELGDVDEVLAVEADDERGDEHEASDHGQTLHHLVLVVRDLRDVVVADARKQVAREL